LREVRERKSFQWKQKLIQREGERARESDREFGK